jgi:hypothetical protein
MFAMMDQLHDPGSNGEHPARKGVVLVSISHRVGQNKIR